jgi:hypothetical protein
VPPFRRDSRRSIGAARAKNGEKTDFSLNRSFTHARPAAQIVAFVQQADLKRRATPAKHQMPIASPDLTRIFKLGSSGGGCRPPSYLLGMGQGTLSFS